MKRYIQIALLVLVAQCGLSNVMYAMEIDLTPETLHEDDAIVNTIRRYSDLTQADVTKYKLLLRLSGFDMSFLGTFGAVLVGAAATIGAGVGVYQYAGAIQDITSQYAPSWLTERTPSWLTRPLVLASLGSLGVGYISYRVLYPRIRRGILFKIHNFIKVCDALKPAVGPNVSSIANKKFSSVQDIENNLPKAWAGADDRAVYIALENLHQQAVHANALLNQLKDDTLLAGERDIIVKYIHTFKKNKNVYGVKLGQEKPLEEAEKKPTELEFKGTVEHK